MATRKAAGVNRARPIKSSDPLAWAMKAAIAALRSPRGQEWLLTVPVTAAAKLRDARVERAARADERKASRSGGSRVVGVTERFGQRGLERRAQRLRSLVVELQPDVHASSGVAEVYAEILHALDVIDLQLRVAAVLPTIKRKRAHFQIGGALDDLENALWAAIRGEKPRE
jgi:hypothetical protein